MSRLDTLKKERSGDDQLKRSQHRRACLKVKSSLYFLF